MGKLELANRENSINCHKSGLLLELYFILKELTKLYRLLLEFFLTVVSLSLIFLLLE